MLTAAIAAQPASIDGTVVNHATGQPLSGVHVRLMTSDFGSGGIDQVYGAISDKAGHFSITGMKSGIYLVTLDRAGFVQAQGSGPMPFATLPLKPGQNLTGHKLEMNARAMILGRVVDEYGDPVAGVGVQVQPVPPDRESGGFFAPWGNPTDERGEFRILTAPGRYYLQANPDRFGDGGAPEIQSDGSNSAPYVVTYYPNAADAKSAAIVQAAPGQDVAGIEIHLRRGAAAIHALTVAGLVTGIPEGAAANVTLRFGESYDKLYNARTIGDAPDGKFSFTGLQPDFYSVCAQYASGKTGLLSQAVNFQLDNSDQTGVQLALRAGEELNGTLEIAGDSPPGASVEKRTVRLQPADSSYGWGAEAEPGETGHSGAFRLTNVVAGRFHIEVEPLPDNAFIKSITLDGVAVPDSILDFSRGVNGSRLKITVSLNGAQISGKVLGHDGEPLVLPQALVMVWQIEKEGEKTVDGDRIANGEYSIKALGPGKYRLVAIDTLEIGDLAPGDGDEALKSFKAAAQEIEVKEGDRIVKDLKVLGKEDLHDK
jgi:Carboxypeptidase regulatory-like domain